MSTEHHDGDRSPRGGRGGRLEIVIISAVLAICAAIVAGTAWSRPAVTAASLAYSQTGSLSYRASTSPTSIYGSAGVTTGQPVYGSVVSELIVSYAYRFLAAAPSSLRGTEHLVATISNGQGITRTVPIQSAETQFTGDQFRVSGILDIAALKNAASAFEQAAGTQADGSTYAVAISPSVSVHGRLGTDPLHASFNSPVSFSYSAGTLAPGNSTTTLGTPGKPDFTPSSTGAVTLPAGQPATLLLGIQVTDARVGSLLVLAAALLLVALLGLPLLRQATGGDERARIAARYGSSVVQAEAVEAHAGAVVVQLGSFDGLLQVARRLECPILHWGDAGDVYAVVDSGTLYRYRAGTVPGTEVARNSEGSESPPVRPPLTETAQRRHASEHEATALGIRELKTHE